MSERVQSVERSIDILSALAEGTKTVTQIAQATGLSKPTAFRLLGSLRHRNMVIKDDETNIYMLGPGWLRMLEGASAAFQSIGILARKPMADLTARTGETSVVHGRVGAERVCFAQVASSSPVRYTISVGAAAPIGVGSSGKVLLAFGGEDRGRLLAGLSPAAATEGAVTSLGELERQLAAVRAGGYAVSIGERTPGAAGVSVPVRGPESLLVALSVIGPAERFTEEHVDMCRAELLRAAAELEAALRPADRVDL